MQIVGYETEPSGESETASLVLASDGAVTRQSLTAGTMLDYSLGRRHCAGVIDDETHQACDRGAAPYCDDHTSRWACARCTGDCTLPLPSCREEHAVYLAAFAPETFKVGVTRSWRLNTRLREQGADRAAHLQTVADGRVARQIEREIARDLSDRVRVPTKANGLHEPVEESAWESLLSEHDPLATYSFDYGFDLDRRPQRETLASGTVVGTKGRLLLLENRRSIYTVDLRDLVGHELSEESGSERQLQASFSAFK